MYFFSVLFFLSFVRDLARLFSSARDFIISLPLLSSLLLFYRKWDGGLSGDMRVIDGMGEVSREKEKKKGKDYSPRVYVA
jgi:hypothetical protein